MVIIDTTIIIKYFLSFLSGIASSILFNIEKRNLLYAGLTSLIANIVYNLNTKNEIYSSLMSAFVVTIVAEILARIRKTPTIVFLIPGIIPLTPGLYAFLSIEKLVLGYDMQSFKIMFLTISIAFSITFGIILGSSIFTLLSKNKNSY